MSISKVGTYAFYYHPNLESAKVSAPTIEANAFQNSTKLGVVDLTADAAVTIGANAFSGCSALENLIVRSSTAGTLSDVSALTNTKIYLGRGGIYVPANLVDTYKAKTNWTRFRANIFSIGEYPKSDFSSISDSWSNIISNANYNTDYVIGDTKTISVNNGTMLMQLVAKDTDIKSTDHTSKARMTWLCKYILTTHRMNATDTSSGGWGDSEMRSWLRSDILTTLPSEVQNAIVPVDKTYRCTSPNNETLTISDTIWIPSYKEVGFTKATSIESDGVVYSEIFSDNDMRKKYYNDLSNINTWYLRSAGGNAHFSVVNTSGKAGISNSSTEYGVVFGFCI